MDRPQDHIPSAVPATAKQDGSIRDRWSWAEPAVWTERMLTALETGVQGGVWFSLMDKVLAERNLRVATAAVVAKRGAPGIDHETVEQFAAHVTDHVAKLTATLHAGTFVPQAIRRVFIPKPGSNEQRPLGIPTVRDRVVQAAIRHVLEPIFEREFATHSYGFRPQRGCKDALRRVDELLKQGFVYVVDADLKSYFDTIPHDRLLKRLRERIADHAVLRLIESFLTAGILDGASSWVPEAGAPQGAVLSPLLSNIYLNPLDHLLAAQGFEMVRYADDFVILCRSAADAARALAEVRQWCDAERLVLHPSKTQIVDVRTEGFDFLGYHFVTTRRGRLTRWPRAKSLAKLKERVRAQTRRTDGRSLACLIAGLNRTLRGWFGYFQHSSWTTFAPLDGWIRQRLRSVLRRRSGRQGRGRGRDHQRWPNAYFGAQGLFSLAAAHALFRQSPFGVRPSTGEPDAGNPPVRFGGRGS